MRKGWGASTNNLGDPAYAKAYRLNKYLAPGCSPDPIVGLDFTSLLGAKSSQDSISPRTPLLMHRNFKAFTTFGLVLIGSATLAFSFQDSKPAKETTKEVVEKAKEEVVEAPKAKPQKIEKPALGGPRRLGSKLGGGIKVKPRPSAGSSSGIVGPQVTGVPQVGPSPVQASKAPIGKGGVTFPAGANSKDFGSLIQGAVERYTFHAESNGEEPLVINSLNKSCGCTRAELVVFDEEGVSRPYQMGEAIPAGVKFGIESTFDTTSKSNQVQSNITLMTNDPRGGMVFSLHANVMPALTMTPRSINFTQMKSADVRKGQVIITSEAYGKFKLSIDENVPLREMRVDLKPDAPDENGMSTRWVVNVEGGPNLPEGNLNRAIKLVSNIQQPDKTMADGSPIFFDAILFITGQVLGPVALNPPSVSFGLLRPGQVATRTSVLKVTADDFSLDTAPKTELKAYGTEFQYADDFEVSWMREEATGDWTMSLTLLGIEQEGNGSFRGFVEVQIGHPAKETIELPFSGVIRGGVTTPAGQ